MPARLIMILDVVARRALAPGIDELTLRHPTGKPLPPWQPGAHVNLRLPQARVRQYSLCGPLDDARSYRIAVKRLADGRGGSRWIHEHLQPGTQAHVSAPSNAFALGAIDRPLLLVAGGIGITPIKSMAERLAATAADFQLHYCVRSDSEAAYLHELRATCGDRLRLHASANGTRVSDWRAVLGAAGAMVYACGPASLTDALQAAVGAAGLPPGSLKIERFEQLLEEGYVPQPFQARIASTGQVLDVPAGESLLDALVQSGAAVPSACRIGVCGTCETGWLQGQVEHRDSCLEPGQRQHLLMPCVSRGRGMVVLDI